MVCEHLKPLEDELTAAGIAVIYRDCQPWTRNCRNWTRFACYLELTAIRARLQLHECIEDHLWKDHWSGEERGFYCTKHQDAVIGDFSVQPGRPIIS